MEIKGLASAFFESLGLTDFWLDTGGRSEVAMLKKIFHPFRAAEIKIGDKTLGVLGEVSSEITNPSAGGGIKTALVAAELDFKNLFDLSKQEREFKSISRYPAVIRDIAVLVPSEVRISQVLDLMEAAGGDFLEDVDLFDVYEGREIPEGKKNLAFRLVFQKKLLEKLRKIRNGK
ncbi:MAG: Phenylalanine-tRNA ligase beta subunit [Parcubacteria group bacterium GW2011_GWC2_42_13]|nr:MAG: Phenylalanine-tRNA ligase beta subunit [Parcubacteria group bacterium GW2011_GWC2_42_13]